MKLIKAIFVLTVVIGMIGMIGCDYKKNAVSKEQLSKLLKENPEILTGAIEANPVEVLEALQKAARNAQAEMAKKQQAEENKKLEAAYDNPLKPTIRPDEVIRGKKDAPLVLVEYSDFECPFCARGYSTVMELMEKYGDKLQFIYKHLPLSFHKNARIASQYYAAIAMQDKEKAFKFHDELYKRQKKLKNGESFLKVLAKEVGANMKKLAKDVKSKKVLEKINQDEKEAAKFGIQGTPGFVFNGIPVRGAYPASHFVGIVEELKKRGKLKL